MTERDKYLKYEELLSQGLTKQAIGIELGYQGSSAGSSLNKFIKKYKNKMTKQAQDGIVIPNKPQESIVNTKVESSPVSGDDNGRQLQAYFNNIENLDILKKIIEREKTSDDKAIQEALLIDENILVGDNVRTTIRLDKIVDMEFNKFCHNNRHIAKYHIMSQALKEFLDKY